MDDKKMQEIINKMDSGDSKTSAILKHSGSKCESKPEPKKDDKKSLVAALFK